MKELSTLTRVAKRAGLSRAGVEYRLKRAEIPKDDWPKLSEEDALKAVRSRGRIKRPRKTKPPNRGNGKIAPSRLELRVKGAIAILEGEERQILASGATRAASRERAILNAVGLLRGDDG